MFETLRLTSNLETQIPSPETEPIGVEKIIDSFGVERQVFRLDHNSSLVFRGLEEMPDLQSASETYGQAKILAGEEKPVFAKDHDWLEWCQKTQESNPGREDELLVAPATPLGLVTTARVLAERGFGEGDNSWLDQLQAKLQSETVDDQVRQLYDLMFATTSVQLEAESRQQGLLEAALCLVGDVGAKQIVEAKKDIRQARDEQNWQQEYGGPPNRKLTPEQLDWLAQKNLIAVHTTQTRPEGRILPTAAYNQKTDKHYPRVTIHTSLNHPVESHMWGNFKNQPYTVISPLAELVAENGLPDNLNSVDTYFTTDPTEGLKLPHQTIVIASQQEQAPPIIVEEGRVDLRLGPPTAADIDVLAVASEQFRPIEAQSYDPDGSLERSRRRQEILQRLVLEINRTFTYELRKAVAGEDPVPRLDNPLKPTEQALFNQLAAEARQRGVVGGDADFDHQWAENAHRLLDFCLSLNPQQMASEYPRLASACEEGVRTLVANWSIESLGGRVVKAGPEFSYDETQEEAVRDISNQFGVRVRQHQDTKDRGFSYQHTVAVKGRLFNPDSLATHSPDVNDEANYNFLLEQYQDRRSLESVWDLLEKLRPQHRQVAISGNFLLYTKPPQQPQLPASMRSVI